VHDPSLRLEQPQDPITVMLLRCFDIDGGGIEVDASRYGGCKSWVDVEGTMQMGNPVFDASAFSALEEEFRGRMSGIPSAEELFLPENDC